MTKNIHIYGTYGAETGVLGWILEQSPTYKTKNFSFDPERIKEDHADPWDNHSHDPNHWSHKWIEIQETEHSEMEGIEDIINAHPMPSIWGISYGAWFNKYWDIDNLIKIAIEPTEEMFLYYWKVYAERPITNIKESIDMHIHDHAQDDQTYKEWMYNTFNEYLTMDSVPFWKLQTAFHWGYDRIATNDDINDAMSKAKENFPTYPADMYIDLHEINLKDICQELECEYTDKMQEQLDIYYNYCKNKAIV